VFTLFVSKASQAAFVRFWSLEYWILPSSVVLAVEIFTHFPFLIFLSFHPFSQFLPIEFSCGFVVYQHLAAAAAAAAGESVSTMITSSRNM
jgi:hypothetical protein